MPTYQVYGYCHRKESTYTGKKRRPSIIRQFTGEFAENNAHRYAKNLVEEDKASYASVERYD